MQSGVFHWVSGGGNGSNGGIGGRRMDDVALRPKRSARVRRVVGLRTDAMIGRSERNETVPEKLVTHNSATIEA